MNELELILTDVVNCSRTDLYLNSSSILLKDKQLRRLDRIFRERSKQVPIQYILGYAEFMGLRFKVNKDVFIPRPETEILVEIVIRKLQTTNYPAFGGIPPKRKRWRDKLQTTKILDIGTGSGCIAISLAKFLKDAHIVAIDISKEAVKVACENAKLHNVEEKVSFLEGDFFIMVKDNPILLRRKFDVIVSNPSYVPTSEIGMFDKTTACEPKISLDGGRDGLDFYRRLSRTTINLLKKDGLLIMEVGYNQASRIEKIFSCGWLIQEFIKDYQGIERVCQMRPKLTERSERKFDGRI